MKERERRWGRVRAKMEREGLDVITAPDNPGHSSDFQADARYLSQVGGGGDCDIACIFPSEGEVTAAAKDGTQRWLTTRTGFPTSGTLHASMATSWSSGCMS